MSGYEMPPLSADSARVLPFRRPSRAVRVRRKNPWLALARQFAQAILVVGVPAAAALWLFTSPTFALAAVDVGEHTFVERAWVESTLAPLSGRNLFRVELDEVRRRLAEHPWIERVTVEKRLPNRLRVDWVEKRPAALFRNAASLAYLDAEGRAIAPFDPFRGPSDLLLVSEAAAPDPSAPGGIAAPQSEVVGAYRIAAELETARSDWAATLSEIEVLGNGDYRLHLAALDFPLLVRAGSLAARLRDLPPLLPELERRYGGIAFIDLRFDRRIIFQPAPKERTGEWPSLNSTS